ncbi:CheR family methyltransferase [Paenibacillus eucommiae]|nr:protein-glutamate O-methyltransferase CheR [Paenibacillus eucommiae]
MIEIKLLLEGIYRLYGYDYRNYNYASIRRRILLRMNAEQLDTISALQNKVLHDHDCLKRLLSNMVISVTEMYRDPDVFALFRSKLVPWLRTLPAIRIWHAGCSTGEEVYSIAMLLHEEGLYEKTRIYATDIHEEALQIAESATYPLKNMQIYTKNYQQSGGINAFSQYYKAGKDHVTFHDFLKDNIIFAEHNLVTDGSFNEFHVIFCRNVLIYFNNELQDRVHHLFYNSLGKNGFLILGQNESISFSKHQASYEQLDPSARIYRKIR